MKIDGTPFRSIWVDELDRWSVRIIDQTKLPWAVDLVRLTTMEEMAHAIKAMLVRGAPLIGASAAYGVALAMRADASDANLANALAVLGATRPTAINLRWALTRMQNALQPLSAAARAAAAYEEAAKICDEDVATNRAIGEHGLPLIAARAKNGRRVNVLTHCNAGWIATVDWGTALAPIYMAHDSGIDVHVWVEETRPRNQGASLTAWELGKHGVKHTVIADNAGGHMMQRGDVDLVIVGTDRVTRAGDVCQQDRHLPEGAGRARQWRAVLGGAALLHHRLDDQRRALRHSHRGARGIGGHHYDRARAGRLHRHRAHRAHLQPGGQPGLRRHARAARLRADHRARAVRRQRGGADRDVQGCCVGSPSFCC